MKKSQYIICGLLFITFILLYILNYLYPIYSDDWLYSFIYNSQIKIDGFSDVIQSQYKHYFEWGGRAIVHSIAQLLIWIGKPLNDILNAFVFTVFIYCIYRYSLLNGKTNIRLFLVLFLLSWTFLPAFITTVLWLTGSANYLWGTVIVLLFLYPFYLFHQNLNKKDNIGKSICFFLFGLVAGWTLENMFVVQVSFIILLIFISKKQGKAIPKWIYWGFAGLCIGGILMLSAPGNFIRSEHVNESLGLADKTMIYNIGYRLLKVAYRYAVYVLPLMIIYAVLFYIYWKKDKSKWRNNKIIQNSLLFFIPAHIGFASMIATPIFPPRAAFGIIAFIIIAIGILFSGIDWKTKLHGKLSVAFIAILGIYFVGTYCCDIINIKQMKEVFENREQYVEKSKAYGNFNIIFSDSLVLPARYDFVDLSSDSAFWLNRQYRDFYEIESVRIIEEKNK